MFFKLNIYTYIFFTLKFNKIDAHKSRTKISKKTSLSLYPKGIMRKGS